MDAWHVECDLKSKPEDIKLSKKEDRKFYSKKKKSLVFIEAEKGEVIEEIMEEKSRICQGQTVNAEKTQGLIEYKEKVNLDRIKKKETSQGGRCLKKKINQILGNEESHELEKVRGEIQKNLGRRQEKVKTLDLQRKGRRIFREEKIGNFVESVTIEKAKGGEIKIIIIEKSQAITVYQATIFSKLKEIIKHFIESWLTQVTVWGALGKWGYSERIGQVRKGTAVFIQFTAKIWEE